MTKLHKPFPVPEAQRTVSPYILEAGPLKYVFLDRNAAADAKPCWLIYVPDNKLVYRASEWQTKNVGGLTVRGRGHRNTPLMPDGPAFWVETTAAIEVTM